MNESALHWKNSHEPCENGGHFRWGGEKGKKKKKKQRRKNEKTPPLKIRQTGGAWADNLGFSKAIEANEQGGKENRGKMEGEKRKHGKGGRQGENP